MAIVARGLGQPEEGALVAGGLGRGGIYSTIGSVTGVTLSLAVLRGFKVSVGTGSGGTASTGGVASRVTVPDIMPFGIELEPGTLHRWKRTRGMAVGGSGSVALARGVSGRRSDVLCSSVSTAAVSGISGFTNDDEEVMLLLGLLSEIE